jgi:D-3-phosphoglycerate dehydrogenase
MKRVLLTDHIADAAVHVFDDYAGIEAHRIGTPTHAELLEMIADYDAIIVRSPTRVTADVIEAGRRLRFIGRAGVGVDNIDVYAAARRNVVVMNSPGANTVSTAEHTIAVMLAVARHLPRAHGSLVAGRWERVEFRGMELCGKTLGVIGLGRVGREVARRMAAFEMRVLGADPFVSREAAAAAHAELVPLEVLIAESDWITLHVPLAADTAGLIGAAEIARMKDGVVIVNCARGDIVDEHALADALEAGKVAAAGLDVFAQEPPGRHRLFSHPRSVFTPHIAAATAEAQLRVATDIARAVADALSGKGVRDAIGPPAP